MSIENRLLSFLSDPEIPEPDFRELRRIFSNLNELGHYVAAAEHLRTIRRDILRDLKKDDPAKALYSRIREIFPDKRKMPGRNLTRLLGKELGLPPDDPIFRASLVAAISHLYQRLGPSEVLSAAERIAKRQKGGSLGHDWPLKIS